MSKFRDYLLKRTVEETSDTEYKAQLKDYMRKLGLEGAGPVPVSLLATQDLETNNKSMDITLHTTKSIEKCGYCAGKVHKKKCMGCEGKQANETVKAAFEGKELEEMIGMAPLETFMNVDIMMGPELEDSDGHRIGSYLLIGHDGGWQAFLTLEAAHEFIESVFKAMKMTKATIGAGVFVPHEDVLMEMRMNHGLDELSAQCILADVLESLGKGGVEETGKELEDSAEEAKHADVPTESIVENIKNIQVKRQKATIVARERSKSATSKSFQEQWTLSARTFGR